MRLKSELVPRETFQSPSGRAAGTEDRHNGQGSRICSTWNKAGRKESIKGSVRVTWWNAPQTPLNYTLAEFSTARNCST